MRKACAILAVALVACAPAAVTSTTSSTSQQPLPIIDDDYARALADARASHRPIVAIAGAAWCDPCREMRAVVLADAQLSAHARDVVWLAIDVERDANAAFVARFAGEGLPVVRVIDPETEAAALAWRGTITAPLLAAIVHRAADAIAGRDPGGETDAALARAFRADANGESSRAASEYRIAIAKAAGAERGIAVGALVSLLAASDRAACAELAAREAATLAPESAAPVVATGIECDPRAEPLVDVARRLVADATSILPSDRSALFERIVAADARARDDAAVARDGRAWLAFLDRESHATRSPSARASLDGARLAAHLALRQPDAAIPALAQSERDLPRDYAAPARLARAFAAAHGWAEALRAIDRALALAYGPHRVALLARKVDILVGSGETNAALRTLDDALVLARSLALFGSYAGLRATLEIRRAEWHAR